jgi:hypothetical protein
MVLEFVRVLVTETSTAMILYGHATSIHITYIALPAVGLEKRC